MKKEEQKILLSSRVFTKNINRLYGPAPTAVESELKWLRDLYYDHERADRETIGKIIDILMDPGLMINVGKSDAIDSAKVMQDIGKEVVQSETIDLLNIKIVRLINLLGDITAEASNNPARLTAFNSPLLQLACIEVYNHHNPDRPVEDRTEQIFTQMAKVGYNV